jgi:hypothetical protein
VLHIFNYCSSVRERYFSSRLVYLEFHSSRIFNSVNLRVIGVTFHGPTTMPSHIVHIMSFGFNVGRVVETNHKQILVCNCKMSEWGDMSKP